MTIELPERLPDDLEEIAAAIPPVPRGLGALRQTLALLPWPLMAATQGSFPADEVLAPEAAAAAAGLGTQPGPGTIGPGGILEGAVGVGQLRDGAVTGAAFASTIRPVYLVNSLPTLPDAAYPVDSFVFNLGETPHRLYKNEADVWVKMIGPNDIQADSITAGQLAAGAVSTSELAVGARLTGELANESGLTPGVFIDTSGILIRSGKLTLQDEFGLTAMQASGFSGTWAEFLGMGLYNATLAAGDTGALALGRTSDLPYWTVARDDDGITPTYDNQGSATLTRTADTAFPGGFRVRCQWSSTVENAYLISDKVAVVGGFQYPIGVMAAANRVAGTPGIISRVRWYDASLTLISEDAIFSVPFPASEAANWHDLGTALAPEAAAFAALVVQTFEETAHSASNYVDVGSVSFGPGSSPIASLELGDLQVNVLGVGGDGGGLTSHGYIQVLGTFTFGTTDDELLIGRTSFPTGPASGWMCYRTDRKMWFQYDGTQWVCTCPHRTTFQMAVTATLPLTATANNRFMCTLPVARGMDILIEDFEVAFLVESGGSALSGSHKWVGTIDKQPSGTTIATLTIASGSSNAYRTVSDTVDEVVDLTGADVVLLLTWTKTGTPGDLQQAAAISYRYIG